MGSSDRPFPATGSTVLTVAGLGKTYVETVLTDVCLSLRAGEALALVGENGAGKSTLSKLIAGLEQPTTGTMTLGSETYQPRDRRAAEARGVRMVLQELSLVPTLTIAENLFLQHLPSTGGWISRGTLREQCQEVMGQVGLGSIPPDTPVAELGIGHRQMVEIARNLLGECRVLILDEPTAMLSSREVELLFAQIGRLKAQGVAIVYISHRLEELARVAERFAVLRDGTLVCQDQMNRFTPAEIVRLMAGREVGEHLDFGVRPAGSTLLRVEGLGRGEAVKTCRSR